MFYHAIGQRISEKTDFLRGFDGNFLGCSRKKFCILSSDNENRTERKVRLENHATSQKEMTQ